MIFSNHLQLRNLIYFKKIAMNTDFTANFESKVLGINIFNLNLINVLYSNPSIRAKWLIHHTTKIHNSPKEESHNA